MKNGNRMKKNVLSVIAALALSATGVCGAVSFTACGDKSANEVGTGKYSGLSTTKIATADGVLESINSDRVFYVSNTPAQDADGSKEKPYDIGNLLGASEDKTILKPGDTVLMVPGTYRISMTIEIHASGAFNSYLKIMNAAYVSGSGYESVADKEVILDFSEQAFASTARGVQIYGDYIYWHGIDVCGAGDNGLYIGGSYNTIEYSEFYNNRDSGLQLGRSYSDTTDPKYNLIDNWPSYNLIKNCTSHNNYDNETYGENADGFAAKLTVGYGNVFDGCIAYRNSDDGWDLYAKTDSGNIGTVIMYNCVAYENGYLEYTQRECNKKFPTWTGRLSEAGNAEGENKYGLDSYLTRDGDGNGFKLGGSVMEGDVLMYNCLSFNNRMHGVTDNSNPGVISVNYTTSFDNSAAIDNDPTSATFGQIIAAENHETHGNINMARQSYSYNNISHVLSAWDNIVVSLEADEYRASVTDSILCNAAGSKKANKIQGSIDANTNKDINGSVIGPVNTQEINALNAADIFETLPIIKTGAEYTYNISGLKDLYSAGSVTALNANRAHYKYRNADCSINMGTILDIKDGAQSKLLGSSNPIGSDLNKASWGDYTHFYVSDYVDSGAASRDEAIVARTKEALTLNCDVDGVFQDFDVPSKMIGCTIEWSSSDAGHLEVDATSKDVSLNKAEYVTAVVNRPIDADVKVVLTATIKCGDATDTKVFTVNIKHGTPVIGRIFAKTQKGEIIDDGDSLIIDLYSVYREPEIFVENGLDYNGKLLNKDLYTVDTTYMFAVRKGARPIPVKGFTPSNSGVYTITKTITLKANGSTKSMTYTVYNASVTAKLDFVTPPEITVNKEGYNISATALTAATGALYAVSSPTELTDLTAANIKTYSGVTSYPFRGDTFSIQFKNENKAAYYVYYALSNVNGEVTSQVYSQEVTVQNISTHDEFMDMAGGVNINSTTIYKLTNDLDFSGVNYRLGSNSFKGLFNGMGHTISNVSITGSGDKDCVGIFYKVGGGTVENVKFHNIKVNGGPDTNKKNNKVGIVGECTGGNFYNIALTEIDIETTGQRAGGLLGYVGVGTPVYIEQVSLVNSENSSIKASQRAGGLVGFSQASSSASGILEIYIDNCYVDTVITASYELGGIFGTYDCGVAAVAFNLEISSTMFVGTVNVTGSKTFAAGILGYQKGSLSQMRITDCISIGKTIFNNTEVLTGLKNSSGIVGAFTTTLADGLHGDVKGCIALIEEYNSNFAVTVADSMNMFTYISTFNNKLDSDYWTYIFDSSVTLKAPYVQLKFLGNWS